MTKSIKILYIALAVAMAVILVPEIQASSNDTRSYSNDTLFQASTISSLMVGDFDGTTTIKELKAHGDFGVGTVDNLDGEMIGLDGQFYQVKSNGVAYPINDSMETPFAEVVFFNPDEILTLNGTSNLTQIENYLDSKLATKNIFYAIRIDGTFDYVKTRSVPVQSKPYPTLAEAVKGQKVFEFHNISGTLVGFRSPDFANGINVPGYHMHFITSDRSSGGHLLDLKIKNASIKIDDRSELEMILPNNEEFNQTDLSGNNNNQTALKNIESDTKK